MESRKQLALLKSLEKAEAQEDHQVVGQETKGGLAVLAVTGAGGEGGAQPSLHHGEDRLDLPPLAVGLRGEPAGQPSAMEPSEPSGPTVPPSSAAAVQGEDASDAEVVSAEAVGRFAVIAGVAQECGKGLAAVGLPDGGLELAVVGLGPSVHHEPQDQMTAGVAKGRNLRITGLVVGPVTLATPREIVRHVTRFQTRRVDGGQAAGGRDQADPAGLLERGVEEPRGGVFFRSRRWA